MNHHRNASVAHHGDSPGATKDFDALIVPMECDPEVVASLALAMSPAVIQTYIRLSMTNTIVISTGSAIPMLYTLTYLWVDS